MQPSTRNWRGKQWGIVGLDEENHSLPRWRTAIDRIPPRLRGAMADLDHEPQFLQPPRKIELDLNAATERSTRSPSRRSFAPASPLMCWTLTRNTLRPL